MFYNTGIATCIWVLTKRHHCARARCNSSTRRSGSSRCARTWARKPAICRTRASGASAPPSSPSTRPSSRRSSPTRPSAAAAQGHRPNRAYAAKEIKALKETAGRADDALLVIRKIPKKGTAPDPLHGLFAATIDGRPAVVEYEPCRDLRDIAQVPLLEEGGIKAFLRREVLPHAPDAWYVPDSVKTDDAINFTRCFCRSPCVPWRRSAQTSWRWRGRPRGCWMRSSEEAPEPCPPSGTP